VTTKVSLAQGVTFNHSEDLKRSRANHRGEARLYHLVKLDQAGEGTVTLQFDQPGVHAMPSPSAARRPRHLRPDRYSFIHGTSPGVHR